MEPTLSAYRLIAGFGFIPVMPVDIMAGVWVEEKRVKGVEKEGEGEVAVAARPAGLEPSLALAMICVLLAVALVDVARLSISLAVMTWLSGVALTSVTELPGVTTLSAVARVTKLSVLAFPSNARLSAVSLVPVTEVSFFLTDATLLSALTVSEFNESPGFFSVLFTKSSIFSSFSPPDAPAADGVTAD